jgi:hypothetical protein
LLLVGDSKLISRGNLVAMDRAGVTVIAPAGKPYVGAEVLRGLDHAQAVAVDYVAERDRGKPAEQRGSYRVLEGSVTLPGKRTKRWADPDQVVRCVFVFSSARAHAARTARAKKLDRAHDDLERVQRGLGGRYYRTAEQVSERLAVITRTRKVTSLLRAEVGMGPDGNPRCRGRSIRPRSTLRPRRTAGMRC